MKYSAILVLLLAFPLVNAIDKPNWSVGDNWDYAGNLQYSISLNDEIMNFSVDGNMQISFTIHIKVVGTKIKEINGEPYACYIVDMNSTTEGKGLAIIEIQLPNQSQSYEVNVDIDLNVKANGKTYLTTDEIAMVESDLITDTNMKISIDAPGVPSWMLNIIGLSNKDVQLHNETVTTYDPPFDFMDFPIEKGEWTAESTVQYSTDGSMPMNYPINLTFRCVDLGKNAAEIVSDYIPFLGEITIDFMGYPIPLMNFQNTTFIWSATAGMMERILNSASVDEQGFKVSTDLEINLLPGYTYTPNQNKAPKAKITYTPSTLTTGIPISFNADASDEDGNIIYYYWEFGDGTTSKRQNPSHTYTKAGTYQVKLVVIDNYGAKGEDIRTITVKGAGNGDGGNGNNGDGNNGTPGFEVLFALIAITAIALRRRLR
ncbi:MAG: PKD domain-containing protein [Thermoplasmata archaeon]|nr:MAG: PKD domain-containing protein [Thermoplasmata archaeon]